ncbi:hypothetical protein HPB48_018001 [Haemaphysalis longicornis]|uniref:Uncharacterized protein n=1 Tax=Haemaphysalis longicornis TaxID=44386 RepID=A0A9J6FH53_HAELO|nr:hypothetical protein HPB48_018001 [Haemaphysalis longicornis]
MSLSAQLITYKRLLEEEYGVDCHVRKGNPPSRRFSAGSESADYFYDEFRRREQKPQRNHRERLSAAVDKKGGAHGDSPRRRAARKASPNRHDSYKGREDYDYYNDPAAKAMPTPPLPPPNVEYEDEDAKEYYDFKPDMKRGDSGGDGGRGAPFREAADDSDDERPARKRAEENHPRARKNEAPRQAAKESHEYPSIEDEGPIRPGSSYEYGFEEGFSKKKLKMKAGNDEEDAFFEDDSEEGGDQTAPNRRGRRQDAPAVTSDEEELDEEAERMDAGAEDDVQVRPKKRSAAEDEDEDEDPFFTGKLARAKQHRRFQRSRYMQMEDDGYEEAHHRRQNTSGTWPRARAKRGAMLERLLYAACNVHMYHIDLKRCDRGIMDEVASLYNVTVRLSRSLSAASKSSACV